MLPARIPKTKLGFILNLVFAFGLTGCTVAFFIWRQDKPPEHPGGPLRGMSGWVWAWEEFATSISPMLAPWALFNAGLYLFSKFKGRHGSPPLSQEPLTPINPKKDTLVALSIFAFIGLIVYLIVIHPHRNWVDEISLLCLILMSLPLLLGMIPMVRNDCLRWISWLLKKRAG